MRRALSAFALLVCALGCGAPPLASSVSVARTELEGFTTNRVFQVHLQPVPDPLPFNAPFALIVRAQRTAAPDVAIPDLELELNAIMPAHGHGMNRTPRITRQPDGSFLVEGMLFHMEGRWDLVLILRAGSDFGQAILPLSMT
ncbi:MAG: hypothetical protein ACT4PU_05400 [Planctomycetota bacterium]